MPRRSQSRPRLESRKDVERTASDHRTSSSKKQTELGNTRADKESAAATANELHQAGTAEGRDAVRKAMEQVGNTIDRHFEKRSSEAGEITAKAQESAEVLGDAKTQTESDVKQIEGAKKQLKERESGADVELANAAEGAQDEAYFLAKLEALEIEIKKDLETTLVKEGNIVKRVQIKTK